MFASMVSWPFGSAQSGPTYRVSDDVVVHLSRAVDANNAEDHKDHGPRVHQRPHRWLPAACVHAGVEAKGGREAGPGPCRGSHSCTGDGPGPLDPPQPPCRHAPFSLGTKKKPLVGPSGLELSRQPGGATHTRPWKGGLWDCAKYSFLRRQGRPGLRPGRPGGAWGGAVRHVWPYSGDRPGLPQHRGLVSGWGLGFGGLF